MWFIYSIRILLILNLVILGFVGQWLNMVIVISVIAITFIPQVLNKVFHIQLTKFMKNFLVLFSMLAQWGGTYLRAYDYISWWDIFLHGLSAVLVVFAGVVLLRLIDPEFMLFEKRQYKIISWFLFMTVSASAVFWEICEFIGDTFFGTNAQLGSLVDTMEDMIICVVIGAIFIPIVGWSIKYEKDNVIMRQLKGFQVLNTSKEISNKRGVLIADSEEE